MIHILKKSIKKIALKFGYDFIPFNQYEESLSQVNYNWLKRKNVKTIIDVGACDGDFIRKFRPVFPNAMIYSFEPNPESFQKLNERLAHDKNFKSFNLALSNKKDEIDFFISSNAGSSSMLAMEELHKENFPNSKNIIPIKVKSSKLDEVLSTELLHSPVFIKLDVQGAEKLVLEGAVKTLRLVDIIYCEINFQELYQGSVLANELIDLLKNYNFNLAGIENMHQSLIDGSYLHGDAIFIKGK